MQQQNENWKGKQKTNAEISSLWFAQKYESLTARLFGDAPLSSGLLFWRKSSILSSGNVAFGRWLWFRYARTLYMVSLRAAFAEERKAYHGGCNFTNAVTALLLHCRNVWVRCLIFWHILGIRCCQCKACKVAEEGDMIDELFNF